MQIVFQQLFICMLIVLLVMNSLKQFIPTTMLNKSKVITYRQHGISLILILDSVRVLVEFSLDLPSKKVIDKIKPLEAHIWVVRVISCILKDGKRCILINRQVMNGNHFLLTFISDSQKVFQVFNSILITMLFTLLRKIDNS